jgi:serine/threonine-protein kinase
MGSKARKTPRPVYDVCNLPQGLEVAGWRILKRLDAGGYGVVYLVEGEDGVRGALKLALHRAAGVPEDPARTEERAERELLSLLLARHPNIVKVLAHGRYPHPVDGYFWFVMPFIDGDPLHRWARRNSPTVREVLHVFERLADALQAAHALGILHRDLKPANIRMRREDGEPVLLDFGASTFPQAAPLTSQTLPPGTITHVSPEAVRFERLHRKDAGVRYEYQPTDDLYALGVVFYEVLTGQLPFTLSDSLLAARELARDIEFKVPPAPQTLNPQVPRALSELVQRLLAKEPLQRHASAEALRRDLASMGSADAAWDAPLRVPGGPGSEANAESAPAIDVPLVGLEFPPKQEAPPKLPASGPVVRRGTLPAAQHLRAALGAVAVVGLAVLALVLASMLLRGDSAPPAREASGPAPLPTATPAEPPATPQAEKPATDSAPMLPASPEKEGPNMKSPPVAKSPPASSTPPPKRAPSLAELCKTLAVGSAAWIAAGCAGVQVRPPPGVCPDDAVAAMKRLGADVTRFGGKSVGMAVIFDVAARPNSEGQCTWNAGPVEGRVRAVSPEVKIPKGTRLYGNAYVDEKNQRATFLYTEAELPGGEKVPVCILGGAPQGYACDQPAHGVRSWPDEL